MKYSVRSSIVPLVDAAGDEVVQRPLVGLLELLEADRQIGRLAVHPLDHLQLRQVVAVLIVTLADVDHPPVGEPREERVEAAEGRRFDHLAAVGEGGARGEQGRQEEQDTQHGIQPSEQRGRMAVTKGMRKRHITPNSLVSRPVFGVAARVT
ncbi:hypothetical protein JCM17961_48830 [Endothiovibrio diazotrophicus]